MKKKIILSADSTCDIGDTLKQEYQVHFYPFHIILDGVDYLDHVTLTPQDIYKAYKEKKILPTTAAINIAEYLDYFKPFVEAGYEVIHINLSSALSCAHHNCKLAAEELGHVYPIDSCNLSTGIGHLVIMAGEFINQGMEVNEIVNEILLARERVHSSFILDTLEFMKAGGRCSTIAALGASLINLKPCIEVDNKTGQMSVGKKYRGNLEKVLTKYTKDKLSEYDEIDQSRIFITHSGIDSHYIQLVEEIIRESMNFEQIYITQASCSISCHCGPNTLGILFMTK